MKTSQFPAADALDGTEIVGIVGGGMDYINQKTTTYAISDVWRNRTYVAVGLNTYMTGFSSIGIGFECAAFGSTSSMAIGADAVSTDLTLAFGYRSGASQNSMAIGAFAQARGGESLAVGMSSYVYANYSTVVGYDCLLSQDSMVAIGREIRPSEADATVFIGGNFITYRPAGSVAIGRESLGVYGYSNVVIGSHHSKASNRAIALGYYAGFRGAPAYEAGEWSIAIGSNAYTPVGPAIAIANHYDYCLAVYGGTTLGSGVTIGSSLAIGNDCICNDNNSIAIGNTVQSNTDNLVMGTASSSHYSHAMVLGHGMSDPPAIGVFASGGFPTNNPLRPVVFHEKLIGQTISPKKATAPWSNGFYTATVTYDTVGVVGNDYVLAIVVNDVLDSPLFASWDGTTLTISLANDDLANNTLANMAGLFPTNGFVFSYTDGFGTSVLPPFGFTIDFAGGANGSPTAILTSDGNSPTSSNQPATFVNSLATMTGTVVAAGIQLFDDVGDAAKFTLAPLLVLRKDNQSYYFIGTPTFTRTSHTAGANGWDVPTLDPGDELTLTVTNNDADVNWMAHLTFEASQKND